MNLGPSHDFSLPTLYSTQVNVFKSTLIQTNTFTQRRTFLSSLFPGNATIATVAPLPRRQVQQVIQWFYANPEKHLDQIPSVFLSGLSDEGVRATVLSPLCPAPC